MAIGTTVKVGFDASKVKSGMSGLSGLFGGFGKRLIRQIGIGSARDMGAKMADLLTRAIMAIPTGIKDTLDWAGNLTDMSAQTGVAVSDLVLMEEALRLAGGSAADTSKMISTLADNLSEAIQEMGPAREALEKLGFTGAEFIDLPVDKAFEMIGKRVANLGPNFKGVESIMADLFGARMGYKLIRFFRDFDGGMKQAENNVGDFARRLDGSAGGYDQMSDALGRFRIRWMETMSIIIDQANQAFGTDWIDRMFDSLSPEKLRNTITLMREEIAGLFNGDGFSNMIRGLGKTLGEGIKEAFGDVSAGSMIKGLFTGGPTASNNTGQDVGGKIDRSNVLLQQIVSKKGGWA